MADFKLITVIGIHSQETFPKSDEVDAAWKAALGHPAFVAAALFKGGHTAPLSGQSFSFVRAKARGGK